jgi:hypothetical protein
MSSKEVPSGRSRVRYRLGKGVSTVTRCRWVDCRRAEGFLVTMACVFAGVSTTAFYQWLGLAGRGPSPRDLEEAYLVNEIHDAHQKSDGVYGEPRITPTLQRTNHKRIERLMRVYGIAGVFKPGKVRTTIPGEDNPPIPDLIGRRFKPGRPDAAWAGDITYIRTAEGWLYLLAPIFTQRIGPQFSARQANS